MPGKILAYRKYSAKTKNGFINSFHWRFKRRYKNTIANGKIPSTLFDKITPAVASPKTRYHGLWFLAFKNANKAKVTKNV
jgi:hypothetical protein